MRRERAAVAGLVSLAVVAGVAVARAAQPVTLWSPAYSVVPAPQRVQWLDGEVVLDESWTVIPEATGPEHIVVRSLLRDLADFHGLHLELSRAGQKAKVKAIWLRVEPGTVRPPVDPRVWPQAYRLEVEPEAVRITGNDLPGLFYGVQTLPWLVQRDAKGQAVVPRVLIEDWPRFPLRFLHWDTKHHQDRLETLRRYVDWAARFKVNMIGFELEDKFAYPSHPVIGAPGAFTPEELQALVDYARERFIQIVPIVQAPAHMAYVLKHPEFAPLRSDGNNYQACLCDPRTYELIFSMYDDVIQATRGVEYFFVSTDEVYYAGIDPRCPRPYNAVNRSLTWVEFLRRAHEHLAKRGRRVLAWLEYPLLAEHVQLLPPDLIDGVIGEEAYLEWENRLGMEQLGYVSMQGSERLFPDHLGWVDRGRFRPGRLQQAYEYLAGGRFWRGRPVGVFGAAWDDSGLHNETFWLGWSAVAQWGWNPATVSPEQHVVAFARAYYGTDNPAIVEAYRLLQLQARAWERSWDRVVSRVRGPGYGNSEGKGAGTTRYDLTLDPPALPALPDLRFQPHFRIKYAQLVHEAARRLEENERLHLLLQVSLASCRRNHYNLEVLLALAGFIRHHWRLITGLDLAEQELEEASKCAARGERQEASKRLEQVERRVEGLKREGEQVFQALVAVYEKSRYPKGRSVGGRRFVHVLDDTKDHWADRTPGLEFMMQPEQEIGLEGWLERLAGLRRAYEGDGGSGEPRAN